MNYLQRNNTVYIQSNLIGDESEKCQYTVATYNIKTVTRWLWQKLRRYKEGQAVTDIRSDTIRWINQWVFLTEKEPLLEKKNSAAGFEGHFDINEGKLCIVLLSGPITSPEQRTSSKVALFLSASPSHCLQRLNSVSSILPVDWQYLSHQLY